MTVLGIDGSNWQGYPDWTKARDEAGIRFVWWKATESTSFVDNTYRAALDGCRAVGLPIGPYHFAHPTVGPGAEQAQWLRAHAPRADLPTMLDLEGHYLASVDENTAWVLDFFAVITGIRGEPFRLLYTNGDGLAHLDAQALVDARVELFWADPTGTADLSSPVGSAWPAPSVHQFSWTAELPGFGGAVDLDAMTEPTLARYTYNPPPPDPGDDDDMRKPQTVLMDDGTAWAVDLNRTPPVRWHIPGPVGGEDNPDEFAQTGAYMGWWEPLPAAPSSPNVQRTVARLEIIHSGPYPPGAGPQPQQADAPPAAVVP